MITLLSIIALGFSLGMRHATDPDHAIAVTTIVSRQKGI
jgi:high-affinity nickel permease